MLIAEGLKTQPIQFKVNEEEINKIIDVAIENDPSLIVNKMDSIDENIMEEAVIPPNNDVGPNCLALTVKKDYNLSIAKNAFFKGLRMSFKVAISTVFLNLARIFL